MSIKDYWEEVDKDEKKKKKIKPVIKPKLNKDGTLMTYSDHGGWGQ